jgi:NAD(P)-dependent dehydrogenase (short-subunit alcohol dehydrogenase family)
MGCPLSYTKEGLEMQWGANHFGHFALTMGLLPALKEAAKLTGRKSRVVNLSSTAHARSDVDFDDINFKNRPYDPMVSYGQSKTANILFTIGLNNRYEKEGILSNAVMPGVIATNLVIHFDEATKEQIKQRFKSVEKNIAQGASTTVWAGTKLFVFVKFIKNE